jgi:hypothetical protein
VVYTDGHENLCRIFSESIKEMRAQKVAKINGSPGWTHIFSTDGVHLTEAAGKIFVESIISDAEAFFNQEILDLAKDFK